MLSTKIRCNLSQGQNSSYFLGLQEYEKNPYDDALNPSGIIQMGLAENQLSFDLLETWLSRNPEVTKFESNGESVFKEVALFQDYHGLPAFKKALAEFMAIIRGNKVCFDPNKLVLTAGATPANETLMFCLAEPGEAFLIPTPYYPGLDRDLRWRTGVEIVPINCTSSNQFRVTKCALQAAYQKALELNLRVKGVFITNPSNPLGTTMSKNELNDIISFAIVKQIHIVSDEIYSGTSFSSPRFISILEAAKERNLEGSEFWNSIHIVYSLSKVLGLPGFRIGMIYSNNRTVVAAATKMSSFGLISSQTQYLLSKILLDNKFVQTYMEKNEKRLRKSHRTLVSGLQNAGIECLKSNAGLYCWADLRHLLTSNTFESEMELSNRFLCEAGLNICPGSSCHCPEPGWFRICFANMSEETLAISLLRIKTFVDSICCNPDNHTQEKYKTKNPPLAKWIFRVSSFDKEPEPLHIYI